MSAPHLPSGAAAEIGRRVAEILKSEGFLRGSSDARAEVTAKRPVSDLPAFATAAEVGAFVQLTPRTLRRLVLEGRFPAPIRIAKRAIRWKAADVFAWLSEREAAK